MKKMNVEVGWAAKLALLNPVAFLIYANIALIAIFKLLGWSE